MPDISIVDLCAGALRVDIAPAVGGSIARFYSSWREGGTQRHVDWLRPASNEGLDDRHPLAMASFPLLPFCNRIRDGFASFEGRQIRFPPNHPDGSSPHPLHGIGWQRAWSLVEADATRATLALHEPGSAAWPWQFSAQQQLVLTDDRLEVSMSLTNEDVGPMPAGIGHHPYFPHLPGTRLKTATAAMWQTDAEVMPTALEVTGVVDRLRSGVTVADLDLDNNFVGWEHEALIEWPADRDGPARSLLMRADRPLDYFVLYCPRGKDHICAEPVSQCTDWINLLERHGHGPLGGARLMPGESLHARFSLAPRLEPDAGGSLPA